MLFSLGVGVGGHVTEHGDLACQPADDPAGLGLWQATEGKQPDHDRDWSKTDGLSGQ